MTIMTKTIIVVGGPAGTGKTSMAERLSKHFNCPYIEGDSLHPQANIDKMSQGIPLTDDDRWDWLAKLSHVAAKECDKSPNNMAIVTCSILKQVYRHFIAQAEPSVRFNFCFLYASFQELVTRVNLRKNHYMKSDMVKLQYDIMQVPHGDELIENGGNCLKINTTENPIDEVYSYILAHLRLR